MLLDSEWLQGFMNLGIDGLMWFVFKPTVEFYLRVN
jgi:hypothetical protein